MPPKYPQSNDPVVWIGPSALSPFPKPGEIFPRLQGPPVNQGKWTSKFGAVRQEFGGTWHTGDDLAGSEGEALILPQVWVNGRLTETRVVGKYTTYYSGTSPITVAGKTFHQFDIYGLGHYIILEHLQPGEAPGFGQVRTLYAHMYEPSSRLIGDVLVPGETIGFMGSTGVSTGNHTHVMFAIGYEYGKPPRFTRESGELRPFWYYLSQWPFALVPLTDIANLIQVLHYENDPKTTYNLPGQAEFVSNDLGEDGWSTLVIRHRGVMKQ